MQRLPIAERRAEPPPSSAWGFARSLIWGLLLVAMAFWGVLIAAP